MLMLARKPGERIFIGQEIVLTVVSVGHNNVRIGIDAPRELNIVREELVGGYHPVCGGPVDIADLKPPRGGTAIER